MDTHRSRQSQQHDPTARHRAEADTIPQKSGTAPEAVPKKPGRGHGSIFDRIDSSVRVFLGPAERSDGDLPVIHLHDEAENSSDDTLGSIEIHVDSLGHHYAQQRRQPEP